MIRKTITIFETMSFKYVLMIAVLLYFIPIGQCFGDAIHDAAKNNDVEKIKKYISSGGNVNAVDKRQNRTALHYAAMKGHNSVARALIDAGADVNIEDKWGGTPIEATVFDITTWNKNISQYNRKGMGSIHLWNKELFDLLIERNAIIRPERLLLNAVPSNDPELLDHITSKWNISVPKNDERYVYSAVVRGAHESLKWLIDRGAEINKPQEDPNNFTPLHITAMHGDVKAIKVLMNAGAYKSLSMKDRHGRSPTGVAKDNYIRSILAEATPQEIRSVNLKEDIKTSCLNIGELRPGNPDNKLPGVYVNNGKYMVFRSRYNTTGIEITGGKGGLEAEGGLPGGAGDNFIYRFINKSTIIIPDGQRIIFEGDSHAPITFVLTADQGLVYLEGKGKVTIIDNNSVTLPCSINTNK